MRAGMAGRPRRVALALLLSLLLGIAGMAAGTTKKGKEVDETEPEEEGGESDFWGVEVHKAKKVKVVLKDEDDESVRLTQVGQPAQNSNYLLLVSPGACVCDPAAVRPPTNPPINS